jgi:hypothetical protein
MNALSPEPERRSMSEIDYMYMQAAARGMALMMFKPLTFATMVVEECAKIATDGVKDETRDSI